MSKKYNLSGSTVMVTGGAGFIGSNLIPALLEKGVKKIKVLDNFYFGKAKNLPTDKRLEIIKFNLGVDNPRELKKQTKNVDFIFHLAAEKHNQSKNNPEKIITVNINGFFELLKAASENHVKKIVFASSLYANGRMNKPRLKETDFPVPKTIYGISKLTGENMLNYFHITAGLQYIALRFMFVYGPKQWSGTGYKSVIIKNFERIIANKNPLVCGDGKQILDYIYIDDAVAAIIKAVETNYGGEIINVGSGKAISINQMSDIMIKITGSSMKKKYREADFTNKTYRVADTNKAKRILKFSANTKLEKGLEKTFKWVKLNYKNK